MINVFRLVFWIGIGSTAASIFLILFMLVLAGKEGRAIMAARLKSQPLLLVIRKTGNFVLTSGKNIGHSIRSKGGNIFIASPNAMRSMGNLRIGLAFEKSSIIVPPDIAEAIGELEGADIKNIDEAHELEPAYTTDSERLETAIQELQDKGKEIPKDLLLEHNKTQKVVDSIHKIVNFVKYNANPSYIGEAVQQLVSTQLDEDRKSTAFKLGGIAIAFFIVAIGFYIILTKLAGGTCPPCVCEVVQTAARNASTVVQRSIA